MIQYAYSMATQTSIELAGRSSLNPKDTAQTASTLPSLVILGIGHSGTSIVTGVLFELGWDRNDADSQYNESVAIREINHSILTGEVTPPPIDYVLGQLRRPFAIKDPRFALTLPFWKDAFSKLDSAPCLVYLTRQRANVKASYSWRREFVGGEPGGFGHTVDELEAAAEIAYADWPFQKVRLTYEQIRTAAWLFKLSPGVAALEGGLWRSPQRPKRILDASDPDAVLRENLARAATQAAELHETANENDRTDASILGLVHELSGCLAAATAAAAALPRGEVTREQLGSLEVALAAQISDLKTSKSRRRPRN
jgi:hypothetical protein